MWNVFSTDHCDCAAKCGTETQVATKRSKSTARAIRISNLLDSRTERLKVSMLCDIDDFMHLFNRAQA
jgi:hypothetical protein